MSWTLVNLLSVCMYVSMQPGVKKLLLKHISSLEIPDDGNGKLFHFLYWKSEKREVRKSDINL